MDELEKIRRLLDDAGDKDKNIGSVTDIKDLIRKRSLNSIERLQRNILIELIVGSVAIIVLIAITFSYPFGLMGLYLMIPLIYAVLSFIYLFRLEIQWHEETQSPARQKHKNIP